MEKPNLHSNWYRNFFFWIGIIATFAYRIIVIINNYSKFWAQICWYIGTAGFMLYFCHRYQISEKRAQLIRQYQLNEKLTRLEGLNSDERTAMDYIFTTLLSTKEKWNYIFIFVISTIAFFIGLYLDVFAKIT